MQYQALKDFAIGIIREEFATKGLQIKRIYLFGSQARQNALPDSDWDFMVCVEHDLTFPEKTKLVTAIQRKLAEKHVSIDVIIKSEKKIDQEQGNVGAITYYALKDGVLV
jgi:predicted nucleotidyltransferase